MKYPEDTLMELKRFYDRVFYKFENIDELALQEKAKSLKKSIESQSSFELLQSPTYLYNRMIYNLNRNSTLSFDEKLYIIIYLFDPNCVMYELYKHTEIVDRKKIDEEESDMGKQALLEKRNMQIYELSQESTKQIGLFCRQLIKFEPAYAKKYNKQKLDTNIKKDCSHKFLNRCEEYKNQPIVSEERYNEILDIVEKYKTMVESIEWKTLVHHVFIQYELLGLRNYSEQIIFLIETIDPELKILQIYEEESNWNIMISRMKNALNFSSKELVYIEKIYKDIYRPDLVFDEWNINKKISN